jgi:MoxR-like ATPase
MKLPYYNAAGDEQTIFNVAFQARLPVMLTGPTGCGKTRLVEHMAALLKRPLITVACHDDLTSTDLVGRFLVKAGDVQWIDGPLTTAVKQGAICYLDEIVEARRDTLAVLHSLTDHRRSLYLDRIGETIKAPDNFMLVCSYNPTSRSALKELKASFRQRFVSLDLAYLDPEQEANVIVAETNVDNHTAQCLVDLGAALRSATARGIHEPPSTRSLVTAAQLIACGLKQRAAIEAAVLAPIISGGLLDAGLQELLDISMAG